MAGWLYVVTIAGGLFAEFYVAGKLIVSSDAKATAANILASEALFRMAIVSEIVLVAAYVGVSLLLYRLLRRVSQSLALTSVFFATIGNILWTVGSLFQLEALRLLHAGTALGAFNADQLQSFALQSIKMHDTALNVGMVFFGIYCIILGILLFKSGYFPKAIGVILAVGGVFDVLNEIVAFGAPALSNALPDWVQLPGFIGELALTVWLIVVGLNLEEWASTSQDHVRPPITTFENSG